MLVERIRQMSIERVKFVDILALEEFLEEKGRVLKSYWQALRTLDEIEFRQDKYIGNSNWLITWTDEEVEVAMKFITSIRWLQYVELDNLSSVRQRLIQYLKGGYM